MSFNKRCRNTEDADAVHNTRAPEDTPYMPISDMTPCVTQPCNIVADIEAAAQYPAQGAANGLILFTKGSGVQLVATYLVQNGQVFPSFLTVPTFSPVVGLTVNVPGCDGVMVPAQDNSSLNPEPNVTSLYFTGSLAKAILKLRCNTPTISTGGTSLQVTGDMSGALVFDTRGLADFSRVRMQRRAVGPRFHAAAKPVEGIQFDFPTEMSDSRRPFLNGHTNTNGGRLILNTAVAPGAATIDPATGALGIGVYSTFAPTPAGFFQYQLPTIPWGAVPSFSLEVIAFGTTTSVVFPIYYSVVFLTMTNTGPAPATRNYVTTCMLSNAVTPAIVPLPFPTSDSQPNILMYVLVGFGDTSAPITPPLQIQAAVRAYLSPEAEWQHSMPYVFRADGLTPAASLTVNMEAAVRVYGTGATAPFTRITEIADVSTAEQTSALAQCINPCGDVRPVRKIVAC